MNILGIFLAMAVLCYLLLFVASLWNWLGIFLVAALVLTAAIRAFESLYDRLVHTEKKLDALQKSLDALNAKVGANAAPEEGKDENG